MDFRPSLITELRRIDMPVSNEAADALTKQQEVIGKLPVAKDGGRVVPGVDSAWLIFRRQVIELDLWHYCDHYRVWWVGNYIEQDGSVVVDSPRTQKTLCDSKRVADCYSTQAAAEAAANGG